MSDMIPRNSREEILKSRGLLIRQWLVKLAEVFQVPLPSPQMISLWVQALCGIETSILDRAFTRLIREWRNEFGRKFPVPGDVVALIERASEQRLEGEAEILWLDSLRACVERYHPDLGWRGPALDDRIARSIGAAGGVHYLTQCSNDELVWAKKRFIEAYQREEKMEQQNLLPSRQMRELFKPLAEKKSLPLGEMSQSDFEKRKFDMKEALTKYVKPVPKLSVIEITDDMRAEHERKKAEALRRFGQIAG